MPQPAELRKVTLCLLIKGKQVLLAMKKRGFGVGKWNGYGGKVQLGETIEQSALREMQEEGGVVATVADLKKVAVLKFYFSHNPAWNQEVHVYTLQQWSGEPVESEEMRPQWFAFENIPYHEMWVDDVHWLPGVLKGESVEAQFCFKPDGESIETFKVRKV